MYVGTVHARWQNGCRCNFFLKKNWVFWLFSIKTYVFFLVYYVFVFMFLVSMFSDCFYFTSILFYFYFDFHFFSKSHTGWGSLSRTQFSRISYCVRPSVTNPELKKHSFLFLLWLFFFFRIWYCVRSSVTNPRLASLPIFFFRIWYCVRPSVTNPERKKN